MRQRKKRTRLSLAPKVDPAVQWREYHQRMLAVRQQFGLKPPEHELPYTAVSGSFADAVERAVKGKR